MKRFQSTKTLAADERKMSIALPEWLAGKRAPRIDEVEKFVAAHPSRTAEVNKALIKVLKTIITDLQKTDSIVRARVAASLRGKR